MRISFSHLRNFALESDQRIATGLLLAFVLLLPAEPLYNVPLIALGVLGFAQLVSRRARLASPRFRFLCIAFLCMWVPMLASLPDATNFAESFRKTASLCIYFLAGVYAVGAYERFRELGWVVVGVAAICGFWVLDALWQFQTGADWFGFPHSEGAQLTGMFYTGRIGYLLASFAPLVFEAVRRARQHWRWCPVLILPFLAVIVLSGSRSSWGALAIATTGYLLFLACWSDGRSPAPGSQRFKGTVAAFAGLLLAVALTAYAWPSAADRAWKTVQPRLETLSALWGGDREQIEHAVSYRLSIWETALNMWSEHWLNGVGPRGFHHAYREFSPEEDHYLRHDGSYGAAKAPHMQLLEIAAETGLIGLLGYAILVVTLLATLRRLERSSLVSVYPFSLTLMVALFPFSGHLGFYGVLSAGMIWWMVIVNASALAIASRREPTDAPGT